MDWVRRNFDPRGRTSRLAYWRLQMLLALVFAPAWIGTILATQYGQRIVAATLFFGSFAVFLTAGALICIRRVHDRGREAIWALIFVCGPFALYAGGYFLSSQTGASNGTLGLLLDLAGLMFSLWAFVELGFLRGTRGPNDYGPEPSR